MLSYLFGLLQVVAYTEELQSPGRAAQLGQTEKGHLTTFTMADHGFVHKLNSRFSITSLASGLSVKLRQPSGKCPVITLVCI